MSRVGKGGWGAEVAFNPPPPSQNSFKALAKSVLILLGFTAAASATDTTIHKKMFGPESTTVIISNEQMNNE